MELVKDIKEIEFNTVYGIVDNKGERKLYIMKSEREEYINFNRIIIIQNNNEKKLAMIDNKCKEKVYRKKRLEEMIESGQIEKLIELKVV